MLTLTGDGVYTGSKAKFYQLGYWRKYRRKGRAKLQEVGVLHYMCGFFISSPKRRMRFYNIGY